MKTEHHLDSLRMFSIALFIVEVIVIIFYGIFVRPLVHNNSQQNTLYYPMYQDINVMMLIGFGFLMTFIKGHSWSALAYTFFINSVVVQVYQLWQPFWSRVFNGGWESQIYISQKSFTAGSYAVASVLVAFGAVLGRVGPLELLIMALVQIIGYTLNQQIVYGSIKMYDSGGSTTIFAFGAYFGLTVSFILGRFVAPRAKAEPSYNSSIFAFIGTLFLWMFWPSFNSGLFPTSPYQRTVIIVNTIVSLTGSCLGAFIAAAFLRQRFNIQFILNASLAGGVIIGAPSNLFTNLAGSLTIGLAAGIIATMCYIYLAEKLQRYLGLNDTCGVHNLYGIPGLLGGILSAIAIASYGSDPLQNNDQIAYLPYYNPNGINNYGRDFFEQGGSQIAGTFTSLGIAIVFGIIAGFLIKLFYKFEPNDFYRDDLYFQHVPHHDGGTHTGGRLMDDTHIDGHHTTQVKPRHNNNNQIQGTNQHLA